jgi:putative hemolysin
LLRQDQAQAAGDFYSAKEYDVKCLVDTSRPLLELSRSCVRPAYRGGTALIHLWQALSAYVADHSIDYVFGVASFSGTDMALHRNALTLLHDKHRAPPALRPQARGDTAVPLNQLPVDALDRRAAMVEMPALIKAYLRMGGVVGDGAYVDHDFKTTDVCMILDTAQLTDRQRAFLGAS